MERHGRLDILVNNAGAGIRIAPFDEQTDKTIEAIVALNLTGQMFGWRRAAQDDAAGRDGPTRAGYLQTAAAPGDPRRNRPAARATD